MFGFMFPLLLPYYIQVVRENKTSNIVLCPPSLFLSRTPDLNVVLCYCIIVFLDGIQQEMTE